MMKKKPTARRKQRATPQRASNSRGVRARTRARARERFIRRLAESGNVADSARKAGVAEQTMRDLKKRDPKFADLWAEAIDIAADGLEDAARQRGVQGWDEPVYQQGKQVGTIKRYSDRMLEILLKGHRPKFRENYTAVQVNVGDTRSQHETDLDALEVARRLGHLLAQGAAAADRLGIVRLPAPNTSLSGKGETAHSAGEMAKSAEVRDEVRNSTHATAPLEGEVLPPEDAEHQVRVKRMRREYQERERSMAIDRADGEKRSQAVQFTEQAGGGRLALPVVGRRGWTSRRG